MSLGSFLRLEHMRTTIKGGLPCLAIITNISGCHVPAKTNADPDSCYEEEWPEIEWELLTIAGKSADWLRQAATEDDLIRIENELWESIK